LNYAGKFDATLPADGPGTHHSAAYVHIDSPHAKVPADAIIVTDAHLLFNADFKRSGVDLILSKDDAELVLHDYFKGEKRAPLATSDGAHLTGDLVNALTGSVQYSQAGGATAAASQVIGHVTKLAGSATAIRNGVSVILNQGDNVEKGDVVQSGADSTLGITFIDGTVFGLSSNARMVLNEMVYDPNGSNNSSLISLVAGTISFVAGETAKHGDMKIDTPVATMGIRGTAVLVEIDFTVPQGASQPDAKFQVLVEPDGTTGSYILFDKTTLQPIAVVNQAGQQININNGVVSTSASQLSPDIQKLITDVFQQKFASTDPNSTTHFTDSTNPNLFTGQIIKTANGLTATPVFLVTGTTLGSSTPPPQGPIGGLVHIDQAPVVTAPAGATKEAFNITHSQALDVASGIITFSDINVGDQPTASTSFNAFTYTDAHGNVIATSNDSSKLSALQVADIKATEANLVVVQGPNNTNVGQAGWAYNVPDSTFDFLAAGETLTLTYVAEVDSNFAADNLKTLVPFTITITGTNDVPVITTDKVVQTITFSGGTSTSGGPLISGDATSGKFAFTDPDLTDTHTVTAGLTSWKMSDGSEVPPGPLDAFKAALTASIVEPQDDSTGTGTGAISWQFADLPAYDADFIPIGQTLTLTYTVTLTDSQGATDTKTVEVTITGTDQAAEVWIHTVGDGSPDGLWSTAQNWETRLVPKATDDVIIITDQLHGLTPSFPVTIDASTQAVANSVTMNDFDVAVPEHQKPELDIQSGGSLTIGGASQTEDPLPTDGTLTLSADSILHNFGTISVGTKAELLDQGTVLNTSVVVNAGTIKLGQGGDFQGLSSITNSGTIEVQAGGTLNILVDVANTFTADEVTTPGQITVDSGAILALGADLNNNLGPDGTPSVTGGITGGTVTINGTLELQGNNFLSSGTLVNHNQITVTGIGNALDGEKITANHALEIMSGAALLLDQGTNVANSGGTITVDDGATLTLNGATIAGGTVNDGTAGGTASEGGAVFGVIDVTGASTIENASLNNGGVTIESVILTLDNDTVTGTTFTDTASGAIIQVDDGTKLTLSGVTINGGAINNGTAGGTVTDGGTVFGNIDIAGASTIENASLNNGGVTIASGVILTLDNDTVTGTTFTDTASGAIIQVDDGATLTLSGVIINGGTVNDGTAGGTVTDDGTVFGDIDVTGASTIENAGLNNGNVTIASGVILTLDNDTVTGTTITDNGTVKVDALKTLNLSGVTLSGGAISNLGTLDITGDSSIGGDALANHQLTIDATRTLTLEDGATVTGGTLSNSGTVEVEGSLGATLDGVNVTGSGLVQVDAESLASTLVLDDGTIVTGGTLTVGDSGTLAVETAAGATLDDVGVTNNNSIEVFAGSVLTLDARTSVTNNSTVTVDSTATLVLNSATVTGGTLADNGTVHVTGDSAINGATVSGGQVTVDATTTLTLDNDTVTGTTFTDTASGAIIQVDDGTKLTLSGVTINGGAVNDGTADGPGGIIDVTGATTIENASLNNGNVKIESGEILTLVDDTVSGTTISFTGTGETLKLDKATSFGGTIAGIVAGDTIDLTTTKVTAATFNGSALTVTDSSGLQTTYQISGAPAGDTFWFKSDGATGTNLVVLPNTLTMSPVAETGVEGSPIALNPGVTVNGDTADHDSLATLVVSAIPVGATLSDGHGNSFTATADIGHQQVDVHSWNLSSLTITPANDTNFTLTVAATEQDSAGYLSTTTTSTEGVTVDPTAPTLSWAPSVSGTEAQVILGSLTETITGLAGDSNSTNTLTISGAPKGVVLSDSHGHSVTSDGSTAIDVSAWTLSSLTINTVGASVPDGNFTLTATATEKDVEGNISASTAVSEQVTVNPTAPILSWTASVSGTEPQISLGSLIETITGLTGDSNSTNTLTISGAPAGAVLSDGNGHHFTSDGTIPIDVSAWTLSSLTIDTTQAAVPDGNFTLTATATEKDGDSDSSTIATATERVTVTPEAPTVLPVAESGVEGTAIALNLGTTVNGLGGDSNSLASLVVSAVPVGATLTDGTHSFTASEGSTSVDVHGWNLTSLTITPTDAANFSLGVAATEKDAEGNLSTTTTATEQITVTPEAPTVSPVAESGIAGTPIALDLGVTVNGLTGDSNSMASLMVSTIPIGATLSDGHGNSFTASADVGQQVDVHSWNFSSLTITAAEASSFTLNVAATEKDAEGNLSTTTTATEQVTVLPPYISFADGTINTNGIVKPQISNAGSTIELTDGHDSEAASWFANTVYSVASFTASFDYQATANVPPNGGPADGMAFILQNSSAGIHALGNDGGLLGYGGVNGTLPISPSAAVEFNVFALDTPGTAFATDGAIGNGGTGTYTPTGTFENGDEIQAVISYNGTVLTETLTDLVTGKIFSTSYTVDLASVLGSGTAYVGFSAATGGNVSTQTVSNFNFDPTTVTITVDTPNGLDFQHHDVLAKMGAGAIQSGGSSTSFTIVDSADDLRFVVDGSNLAYGPDGHGGIAITGGTLTSFHEFTNDDTPVALADFNGLPSIDAVTWMSAVQAAANGDKTAINAITSTFSINFIGGSGPDSFGSSGQADTLTGTGQDVFDGGGAPAGLHDTETGGAGSTFVFQAGYGALTITNFDQAGGSAFDSSQHDKLELNGFTGQPIITYNAATNTSVVDFGNGDVITLLGVNAANIPQSDIITGGGDNGGGGNNNGPVFSGANNAVTYTGTPVFLDPSIAVTDPTGTVTSVNVWISSGSHSGDQFTINGTGDGTITDSDGSVIHYHFDNTTNPGQPSIFLSGIGGTPTTADFQAAMELIQFTPGAADGNRTVNWAAFDTNNNSSPTVTTTVAVGPVLNSFTLAVTQGGTTVLTNNDFNVSDPGFTNLTYTVGNVSGGQFEVFNGTNWVSAPTGGFTTAQIAAGHVEFVQDGTPNLPNFSIHVSDPNNASPDIAPTVLFKALPWGTSVIAEPNRHLFNAIANVDTGINTGAVLFATAPLSGFNPAGPDPVTENVGLFDPFVLPYQSGIQQIQTSSTQLPLKYNVIMPPVTATSADAIAFYTTETGGVSTIHQDIISEPASGPNGTLTGATTTLESNLSGSVTALYDSYTTENANDIATPAMTSYSIAWAVYDGSNYNAQFQIFPAGGGQSAVGTVESLTGLTAATLAPAWEFRNAGALSDRGLSVPYASVLAVADLTHTGQQDVMFQGYNADGSVNPDVHFLIAPDLSHFLSGATNQITQPSTGASLLFTPNGVQGSGFSVAWSETVTDGNGTHSQVEFDIFKPSGVSAGGVAGSGTLISHTTFQVPDAENIRIVSADINGASVEYLAYGDATSTTVVEFDANGNQLATIVDRDHTVTYSDLEVMADGRIALTYPDSAQYTTDIFDLRQTGVNINDSGLSDGQAKYVAGTHFNDTFTGENNDTNFYYFVGQDTLTSAPTDHFNGGTGANAWNEAVFADARANYTISTTGGVTTVTNIDPQHAHAGTVIVDQNVQALAFNPTQDPTPHSDGSVEATGDTLLVLSPFAHAAQIDAGATLEFAGADSGSVTFNAATGTLKLDAPAQFSGQIAGISGAGNVLDLHGFAAASTTAVTGDGSYNSTSNTTSLTVTDSSDHQSETFTLAGNLSGSAWTVSDDHNGGVNIVDPPASSGQSIGGVVMNDPGPAAPASGVVTTMVEATGPIAIQTLAGSTPNQTLTSTGAGTTDNFVFNFGAVGHETVTDFRPTVDSLQFAGSIFADPQAALNATQDDGHGNTVIALDPHDTITLTGVLKAQLHVTDFHVV
jgi:fibronectin-binding autotransporter adhesin